MNYLVTGIGLLFVIGGTFWIHPGLALTTLGIFFLIGLYLQSRELARHEAIGDLLKQDLEDAERETHSESDDPSSSG